MLLHDARRNARLRDGEVVSFDDQNRALRGVGARLILDCDRVRHLWTRVGAGPQAPCGFPGALVSGCYTGGAKVALAIESET